MPDKQDEGHRAEDSPVAWFAVLETARQACDFEKAGEAQRQLRRLGVEVKYTRPSDRPARRSTGNGGAV